MSSFEQFGNKPVLKNNQLLDHHPQIKCRLLLNSSSDKETPFLYARPFLLILYSLNKTSYVATSYIG